MFSLLAGQQYPVQANCNDSVGSLEWHEPMFAEHFQALQQRDDYPWGNVPIYDRIEGRSIFLTENFEQLSSAEKRQALDVLVDYNIQNYLTPEEYEQKLSERGLGRLPHRVIANDGRLLSAVYDGCTRFTLLTERERYGWAYVNQGRGIIPNPAPDSQLRNAGYPEWRQVNVPINPADERSVRLSFWNSVGYEQSNWWIAWVPEQGYFEINVPENYDTARLEQYWQVADPGYRYVVVSTDGTQLADKRF
ncbi:hypothetical protein [Oscillatoria sp. CS-180]|uniref:hypothetical protein n=1 Tax=Oscillatoria sp. CS-180 TaxID=3021720 RepID=UPI00232F636E|nr:hypothetical protein [Oscillatoria sp. CS-180]